MIHETQNPSRWVSVRSQRLSLWQSAVEKMLLTNPPDGSAPCESLAEVRRHRVMAGVNRHVKLRADGAMVPPPDGGPNTPLTDPNLHAYVSHLRFEIAEATRAGDKERLGHLLPGCKRYFATCDTLGWATCVTTYLEYMESTGGVLQYNDWTVQGEGNINYGMIDWKLPNDAAVAIIGDWGTGLPDAQSIVAELMLLPKPPAAIIHLGDIYYSGTPDDNGDLGQCTTNFINILAAAAPNVPVFTIPGNHDYYDWGVGFYQMLPKLNAGNAAQSQEASYFCLRTEDNTWQFLAGDTGQDDTNPRDELKPAFGPTLRASEIQWHHDKLQNFAGTTLLMTHHQFFTANEAINNSTEYPPYINMFLGNTFAPFFSQIAAWFWGHEHNLALFQNGLFGLKMGRLVGSSAYEEATSDSPYTVAFPEVPFNQSIEFQAVDGFYPHACAVIDLERASPTDPISITYYQMPSWGDSPPTPLPGLTPVITEFIDAATG